MIIGFGDLVREAVRGRLLLLDGRRGSRDYGHS